MKKNVVRTWIEIDKKAIKNNYGVFKKLIGGKVKLCVVVKSNAYGHGLVPFALEMQKLGADFLAVDSTVEAISLRENGIDIPVLVLGYIIKEKLQSAIENSISITVSNFEMLKEIEKKQFNKKVKIHIKCDTGMHRQGFLLNEKKEVFRYLKKLKNKIEVEGVYTHFAMAKSPAFPEYTNKQIKEFKLWRIDFTDFGYLPIFHASATSGTILFSKAHFDMVRIGIGSYGLWPSKEVESFAKSDLKLKPVLTWKTIIGEIKEVQKGCGVGYDITEVTKKKTKLAICPVGYWHGYSRKLSGVGNVIIKGQKARIFGRVSMDMVAVDVTKVKDAKAGDAVTLLGCSGKEEVTATELAELSDTINYELVTCINSRVRRVYK